MVVTLFVKMEIGIEELRMYIDYKIENINAKVDNALQETQGLHAEIQDANKQTTDNLNRIIQMSQETNERLDKIWETVYKDKK